IKKQGWQKVYCREPNLLELVEQASTNYFVKDDLANCDVSITGCEALVARTGSVMMTTAQPSGRTVSVYAPVHICIAWTKQLIYDVRDALQIIKDKYGDKPPSF